MISSAAPTKPKAEREAFPIPGPWGGKNHFSEFNDTIHLLSLKLFLKYRN